MSMPKNLIFVRHGQSEGNVATDASKTGDDSHYTKEFREQPGHQWDLTQDGAAQAKQAGRWLKDNLEIEFDRFYVSPFVRTRQTAAALKLKDASWMIDRRLRERDWGDIDAIPKQEFIDNYPGNAHRKKIDALYWRPPNGESIADVAINRFRNFVETLHRELAGKNVIAVTHGEFMWSARLSIEKMTDEEWAMAETDRSQKIHNAQIVHYTRINPKTGKIGPHIEWVRSVCPWDESLNESSWKKITRRSFNDDELVRL